MVYLSGHDQRTLGNWVWSSRVRARENVWETLVPGLILLSFFRMKPYISVFITTITNYHTHHDLQKHWFVISSLCMSEVQWAQLVPLLHVCKALWSCGQGCLLCGGPGEISSGLIHVGRTHLHAAVELRTLFLCWLWLGILVTFQGPPACLCSWPLSSQSATMGWVPLVLKFFLISISTSSALTSSVQYTSDSAFLSCFSEPM